jgi:hypothetical protein
LPNCFNILIKVDKNKLPDYFSIVELKQSEPILVVKSKKYEDTSEFKLLLKMI